jgi:hypothetical protein
MNKKIQDILTGKVIGISISQSEDLFLRGYGTSHLQDAKIEIARYLLSCGCTLLYGGDLRDGGFTTILYDLVEAYTIDDDKKHDRPRLISYLPWPIDSTLTKHQEAGLSSKIAIVRPGLPNDVRTNLRPNQYLEPNDPEKYYRWSRSLTHMRKAMTKACDARIVLGGQLDNFKGKYPGIIEEAILSIESQVPLFIVGTFGGAAHELASIISGGSTGKLSQKEITTRALLADRISYFNRNRPSFEAKIDYDSITSSLKQKGISSLNNGLTEEENKLLFDTSHIPEIVSLVIKGLVKKLNS